MRFGVSELSPRKRSSPKIAGAVFVCWRGSAQEGAIPVVDAEKLRRGCEANVIPLLSR